jgi:hypothetical protein
MPMLQRVFALTMNVHGSPKREKESDSVCMGKIDTGHKKLRVPAGRAFHGAFVPRAVHHSGIEDDRQRTGGRKGIQTRASVCMISFHCLVIIFSDFLSSARRLLSPSKNLMTSSRDARFGCA